MNQIPTGCVVAVAVVLLLVPAFVSAVDPAVVPAIVAAVDPAVDPAVCCC